MVMINMEERLKDSVRPLSINEEMLLNKIKRLEKEIGDLKKTHPRQGFTVESR